MNDTASPKNQSHVSELPAGNSQVRNEIKVIEDNMAEFDVKALLWRKQHQ